MMRLFKKTTTLYRATMTLALSIAVLLTALSSTEAFANTQSDQRKVRKEIKQLNRQIDRKKKESGSIGAQVTRLEKELGALSGKQHDTERKIKAAQKRLLDASAQKSKLHRELKRQQSALAQQLQAMHTAGEQSHLRLLLLQDNPSEITRNLQYFDYLNRYRSGKITEISQTSTALETVTREAKKERIALKELGQELEQQEEQVRLKLASRATALDQIRADLSDQKKRMSRLVSQEKALQKEIDRIARREAKRRAEREAARRKEQAAARAAEKRRQQQRAQQAATNRRQTQARNTASTRNRQQASSGRKVTTSRTPNKPFSQLRGKLSWPVSGRVIHRYNSRRNEKQRWRGVVIAAPGGSKVRAVASGRVVFAGWMNGYGHLIMVEHDRNYMSLYGYNRAVFKRVGQRVNANEVIASVGNSSGQSRNALYFEIRRKTVPQNPARWLR